VQGSNKFISNIKNFIIDQHLFSPGDRIMAGVSGGADSVALISILHALQYELGISLHIVHYNHKLRRGSNADQKFVEKLAARLNLPCTVECWEKKSTPSKGSLEELAREKRFDFFRRLAKQKKANAVALAHTENDLAETVLMRLLRGTGLQGIRGILPQRLIKGIKFVRPLLEVQRKAIEQYLAQNKISFRTDITNRQTKFFRNKVRLELLPVLEKEYNRSIKTVLANLSKTVAVDYEYMELQAQKVFERVTKSRRTSHCIEMELNSFRNAHKALQRMVIRQAIAHLKGNTNKLTLTHMKEVEDLIENRRDGAVVQLPIGMRVEKKLQYLRITRGLN